MRVSERILDTPLISIMVSHEDGFVEEVRVRSESIAEALKIAVDPAGHDGTHGEVTQATFTGYVPNT